MTDIALPPTVADLAPSAKLVYLVLQETDRPLSRPELRVRTTLPDRTLRAAVDRLEDEGVVRQIQPADDPQREAWRISREYRANRAD